MKPTRPIINRLLTAIVQMQDAEPASHALIDAGFPVTHMSSSGGFLGRRNVTLLVGMSEGQENQVHEILRRICRSRIEYIATPIEGSPFHLPLSTPVTVGGATMFTIVVEHFEVL